MGRLKLFCSALLSFLAFSCMLLGAPVITSIDPNFGPAGGGSTVSIQGSGFKGVTSVHFGSKPAASFTINSNELITAIAPAAAAGDVVITVTAPSGTSPITFHDQVFTYQNDWFVYVVNFNGTVTAINQATNSISVPAIPVGSGPFGIAITPNGQFAYVCNSNDGTVSVIDLSSNTVVGAPIIVGSGPGGIAITPDGRFAYVPNESSNNVSVIDLSNNTVVATIPFPIVPGSGPFNIAITPNGLFAYVINDNGNVNIIDLSTNTVVGSIPVGTFLIDIAITPDGRFAYITQRSLTSDAVVVINLSNNTVLTTIALPSGSTPNGIAITPDGTRAYVADSSIPGRVSVINVSTNTLITTFPTGGNSTIDVFITPDGRFAYASNQLSGTVTVIDTSTNTPVDTIIIGPIAPLTLSITPDQSPVAQFTAAVSVTPNRSKVTFNSSLSRTPTGSVVLYTWDFGDGDVVTTSSPKIIHNYKEDGRFTVTLIVTNSTGTSLAQTFTGQTVSNSGSPFAALSKDILVPPLPPRHFKGIIRKAKCVKNTDCKRFELKTSWKASPSENVIVYRIFNSHGTPVAIIPADLHKHFKEVLCARTVHDAEKYTIVAVDADGVESEPIQIRIGTKKVCPCSCPEEQKDQRNSVNKFPVFKMND